MSTMQHVANLTPDFTGASLVLESVKVSTSLMGTTTIQCSIRTTDSREVSITRVIPSLLEGSSATWEIDGRRRNRQEIVGLHHLEDLLRPFLNHS
jgi:hypothetical protein